MHQVELLLTVPGVSDPMTAIRIIAEIGTDMTQFESSKHLCSWAGLIPQNNESAGKKKPIHIGKAGQHIKLFLIQCALAASNPRSKLRPEILHKYQQLKKRRGSKSKGRNRPQATYGFHILLKDVPYAPFVAPIKKSIPKDRILTPGQALTMLRAKDLIISKTPISAE